MLYESSAAVNTDCQVWTTSWEDIWCLDSETRSDRPDRCIFVAHILTSTNQDGTNGAISYEVFDNIPAPKIP